MIVDENKENIDVFLKLWSNWHPLNAGLRRPLPTLKTVPFPAFLWGHDSTSNTNSFAFGNSFDAL